MREYREFECAPEIKAVSLDDGVAIMYKTVDYEPRKFSLAISHDIAFDSVTREIARNIGQFVDFKMYVGPYGESEYVYSVSVLFNEEKLRLHDELKKLKARHQRAQRSIAEYTSETLWQFLKRWWKR